MRIKLRELLDGDDIYRLFDVAGDLWLSLGYRRVPASWMCLFKLDSRFLFDEGGKKVSLVEGSLQVGIRGLGEGGSMFSCGNGEM